MNLNAEQLKLVATTIRLLAADGVEKANSGHPGMPMGMADIAAVLWTKYLRFHPKVPNWIDRDRFVLSNGHGCMLLYSMLHLSGYDLTLEDLKSFRQWDSKTPGHPETHLTTGVEATTGPLGQGISNAVGMALGKEIMAARYNAGSTTPFSHRTFVFCGDGCLMEGVSSEASSLGGHLGLKNLIVLYDDNHISIAGNTELAFSENVPKRYEAYGWHTQAIDGHDYTAIDNAIAAALKVTDRPCLIAARTIIGKGSPHKANDAEVHGAPLGKDELINTKKNLGWDPEKSFYVPEEVQKIFAARVEENVAEFEKWNENFNAWRKSNPEKATQLDAQIAKTVPADIVERCLKALPTPPAPMATRKLSQEVIQTVSAVVPSVIGGSADLEPSTFTLIKKSTDIKKGEFGGLNIRFGVREHGMGAVMNGLSYYGGFIPYGSTFLTFSDYMRPTIRLAAISHLQGLFIFTHDSVFLGEDGPTHQPIEHLNSMRMIPNVHIYRPADGVETALSYAAALKRTTGPSLLILTRQNVEPLPRRAEYTNDDFFKGGYTVFETSKDPEYVFIATGSEVGLACTAAKKIQSSCRVVSMPCVELFQAQSAEARKALIPTKAKKIVIEAAHPFGWLDIVGGTEADTAFVCIDHFGASAPAKVIAEKMGFTPDGVIAKAKSKFTTLS